MALENSFTEALKRQIEIHGSVHLSFIEVESILVPVIAETGQILGGVRDVELSSPFDNLTLMTIDAIVTPKNTNKPGVVRTE